MVIWISVLVAIVGALTYAFSDKTKIMEIGRLAFFAGLFVALLHLHDFATVAR